MAGATDDRRSAPPRPGWHVIRRGQHRSLRTAIAAMLARSGLDDGLSTHPRGPEPARVVPLEAGLTHATAQGHGPAPGHRRRPGRTPAASPAPPRDRELERAWRVASKLPVQATVMDVPATLVRVDSADGPLRGLVAHWPRSARPSGPRRWARPAGRASRTDRRRRAAGQSPPAGGGYASSRSVAGKSSPRHSSGSPASLATA